MSYTNFCCRSGGSNLNAGTLTGNGTVPGTSPSFSYSGTFSGSTFTASAGNPQSDGVVAGQFVHISDGVTPGLVARISSVFGTTFSVDGTAAFGAFSGAGVANIGGAWAGPSGSSSWPVGSLTVQTANTSLHPPRLNMMNNQTHTMSASLTHSQPGVTIEGFSAAYGDQGMTTISGGGNNIVILAISAINNTQNLIVTGNNLGVGTNPGVNITGIGARLFRVVVHTVRGPGITAVVNTVYDEVEVYNCNVANTAGSGGISQQSNNFTMRNSMIHDNFGAGIVWNFTNGIASISHSVFDSNSVDGILISTSSTMTLESVDLYNNGQAGVKGAWQSIELHAKNCNAVKNGTYGFDQHILSTRNFTLFNCGFGSGTQANATANTVGPAIQEVGSITYASNTTPWTAPATGNFSINVAAAQGTGRGTFTQTAPSYTGTVGYPDVGAAQHQDAGGVIDYPSIDDVRVGVAYNSGALTGVLNIPVVGNVRSGVTYDNATKTGVLNLPAVGNVRSGTTFDNGSQTGVLDLPAIGNVRLGSVYDNTTKTGTLNLPAAGNVRLSVSYDNGGSIGLLNLPSIGDVRLGITYDNGTKTGTLDVAGEVPDYPLESDVREGVEYDNGDLIGTLVVTGGGSGGGSINLSQGTVERSVNDDKPITFAWPVSGATITGEVSIDNASYVDCEGAITFLRVDNGKYWYTLAYDAADRPDEEGTARYRFNDGTANGPLYVVLRVVEAGGGVGSDIQEQIDAIAAQTALLSAGRSPQVISPVADGGTITAFIESDYRVRSGTQLRIPVSDAGSVLHDKLTAIGVENLAFGASRANKPAGEILGSVASLSYASSVTTILIEITACGAGLRPDQFTWQIQSSQAHSAEFDDAIEVSGILQLMRRTVPAKG